MMLSGVAVLKSSKSKAAAAKLVSFLLSDEGQNHFAQKVFEYPVRDGVKRHPDVPAIGEDMIRVEQTKLTDVSGTLALLRRLDIN
jgi:iron(III) transport system substrate-binding protein